MGRRGTFGRCTSDELAAEPRLLSSAQLSNPANFLMSRCRLNTW